NADRLRVLTVDPGDGSSIQVICGAPNARKGLVGVFAAPGTHIPGTGVDLEVGTIRGVESRGMMLSEREMGLSDEHDGIVDLPEDAPVGTPYTEWADLNDPVIEIGVTTNRSDCLGVRGIARDLAAAGLGTLKPLDTTPAATGAVAAPPQVHLTFPEGDPLCPAFALRLVEGVTNGPSPDWMQKRLTSIGLRPINCLVDITNFVTFDLGRPLHVFDADKVAGDITVRRAKDGESFAALDGRSYTLDATMCVIADENGVESLAGIMGGEASGCTETTTRVLVESALWEPLNVARTGRALGIHSDARHRFERGVDPAFMEPGLEIATRLILQLCGGEAGPTSVAGIAPDGRTTVAFPPTETKRLSGLDVPDATAIKALRDLGFTVDDAATPWTVTSPPWRPDIEGKADIVEEVVRIVGIDDVTATPLARMTPLTPKVLTPLQRHVSTARRALAVRGMVEAVTWSFISAEDAAAFGGGGEAVKLVNPISESLSDMRPSLLPGLIHAVSRNVNRGHPNLALFEVGQVFKGDEPEDQTTSAAGVRQGRNRPVSTDRHWSHDGATATVYDVKADVLAALAAIGGPADSVDITRDAPSYYHPGRSGSLRLGPKVLARFGELHPGALDLFELRSPAVGFEIFLEQVPASKAKGPTRPLLVLSPFQPVSRDFAFLVDAEVAAEQLIRAARGADKTLVSEVALFDAYEGQGIPEGKKSLAIAVTLQPREKTLTDAEIEAVGEKIVAQVAKATGGVLRA
ncbi:MAG: phenylalanine--tRNA ligase subunit beta, partial [Pseudomonadota bacterium]